MVVVFVASCGFACSMVHYYCLACKCDKRMEHMTIKGDNRRGICKTHYNQGVRMSDFESSSSSSSPSRPSPLEVFTHDEDDSNEMRCKQCQLADRHNHTQLSLSSSSSSSSSTPIFDASSEHHRLTLAQRYAIIVLHLIGKSDDEVSSIVNCHIKSVRRWLQHYAGAEEFLSLIHI